MLDIEFIRNNLDLVKKGTKNKGHDPKLVERVLGLDERRRALITQVQEVRELRNKYAKEKDVEGGKRVKEELKQLVPQLEEIEMEYVGKLSAIPNIPSEDTPVGRDESNNKVIRSWGEPREFSFEPKDHMDMGERLGIIDTETSANVSGARFAYLKGDAVLLQFALIQFALETLTNREKVAAIGATVGNKYEAPFVPVVPPVMMKTEVMKKMDRFDPADERYVFEKDNMVFVGSSEHTIGPMHMGKTFSESELPLRYVGYSTSFRREAGSYGRDTKGIFRLHQFDKLEMESFGTPSQGLDEHELMTAVQEHFMQALEIPYQVMVVSTGDMGKPNHKQTDINAWFPSQKKYRETHTADYMTDYQARRLGTRVKMGDKTEYVHMNDATAFAIGRTLIAIMENYQQKDGVVVVPEVLRSYLGKNKIVPPVK